MPLVSKYVRAVGGDAVYCGSDLYHIANKLMQVDLKEVCCFLNKLHGNLFKVQLYTVVYNKILGETEKVVTFFVHIPGRDYRNTVQYWFTILPFSGIF
jgi:hypothetical protein